MRQVALVGKDEQARVAQRVVAQRVAAMRVAAMRVAAQRVAAPGLRATMSILFWRNATASSAFFCT